MNDKELIENIKKAIDDSKFSSYYCMQLKKSFDALYMKYKFYEDVALHGRDSDDAKKLVMCRNDAQDFIQIDLGMGS